VTPAVPSWWGVGGSVLLVGLTVAIVVREQLGLTREVIVAAVRAIVQLVAVGALLGVLFARAGLPGGLAWVAAMVAVGGRVAGRRGAGVPHAARIGAASIAVGTATTLGLLVAAQVVDAHARVLVPVGGMVVSSATRGASVVLLRMAEEARSGRRQVEARLALGLTAAEAFAPHRRAAVRAALVTDIDAVRTVGLISLPGAMTGLLLAGVDPLTAIRYQVVVMWMILAAVAVSTSVAARLAVRELFDDAERLVVA
jgi:putative ABC transport system permease protein